MDFGFGTIKIIELASIVSEKLSESGVNDGAEIRIPLTNDHFTKVDEDLFYRNKSSETMDFVPSEGEIDITIGNIKIKIIDIEKMDN